MTYWYLDLENVNTPGCLNALLTQLRRGDMVVLAYSSVTPNITLHFLHGVEKKLAKIKTLPCLNGAKNAMDFQICMEVAANCISGKSAVHRVVSKDQGYVLPLKAWRSRGYDVALCVPNEKDGTVSFST